MEETIFTHHSSLAPRVVLYQPDQELLPDNDRVVPVANLNQKNKRNLWPILLTPVKKVSAHWYHWDEWKNHLHPVACTFTKLR